jgi:hypothetical protein
VQDNSPAAGLRLTLREHLDYNQNPRIVQEDKPERVILMDETIN